MTPTFHSRAPLPQANEQRASGPHAVGLAPTTKGSAALRFESAWRNKTHSPVMPVRLTDTATRTSTTSRAECNPLPALILSPANLAKDCQCTEWSRVGGR